MKAFIVNFKKTMTRQALLAVLLTAMLCFCSAVDTGELNPPTVAQCLIERITSGNTRFTSLELLRSYDGGFWFYIILPVILSVPSVSVFSEEWNNGGFYLNIHRHSVFGYAFSKALAYSLNAFLCFSAGAALFALSIILAFPAVPEDIRFNPFLNFLNTAANAMAYPLIATELLILIKEKFLALSIPMLVNYITMHVGGNLGVRAYYEEKPFYNLIACFLLPSYRYASFKAFFGPVGWFVFWFASLALLFASMFFLVKRRLKVD